MFNISRGFIDTSSLLQAMQFEGHPELKLSSTPPVSGSDLSTFPSSGLRAQRHPAESSSETQKDPDENSAVASSVHHLQRAGSVGEPAGGREHDKHRRPTASRSDTAGTYGGEDGWRETSHRRQQNRR